MAKAQLLFILKVIICLGITTTLTAYGSSVAELGSSPNPQDQVRETIEQLSTNQRQHTSSDIELMDVMDDMRDKGLEMTLNHINELLENNRVYGEDYSTMQERAKREGLFVFVSSTMPMSTLKEYARDAVKYSATLVFKGLPSDGANGWREFAELVNALNLDDREEVAIQIDEEPFDEFEITVVPTIILREEKSCINSMSCKPIFDKISGNIGIKYALEQFAEVGDMRVQARELLNAE
jgi:type-F conjugative transfer system pilin assembly protein TrbC